MPYRIDSLTWTFLTMVAFFFFFFVFFFFFDIFFFFFGIFLFLFFFLDFTIEIRIFFSLRIYMCNIYVFDYHCCKFIHSKRLFFFFFFFFLIFFLFFFLIFFFFLFPILTLNLSHLSIFQY